MYWRLRLLKATKAQKATVIGRTCMRYKNKGSRKYHLVTNSHMCDVHGNFEPNHIRARPGEYRLASSASIHAEIDGSSPPEKPHRYRQLPRKQSYEKRRTLACVCVRDLAW